MRYGEWIVEAGRILIRNAYVWILAAPWLILTWGSRLLGGVSMVGLQPRMMSVMNDPLIQRELMGANTPWEFMAALIKVYSRVLGIGLPALGMAFGLNLVVWILVFIIAGAVIHQAMPGHTERPRWQESLHVGLNRAVHLFLIRVILLLPIILLLGAFVAVMFLFGMITVFSPYSGNLAGAMTAFMLGSLCLLLPLLILWGIFIGLLEPLAVQASVQEVRSAWDALARAWEVFWARLGPVIVLGLILFVIRMFVSAFGGLVSPLMMLMQNTTGVAALFMAGIWAIWGLVLTVLDLATTMFGWILYARAWPDLRT